MFKISKDIFLEFQMKPIPPEAPNDSWRAEFQIPNFLPNLISSSLFNFVSYNKMIS